MNVRAIQSQSRARPWITPEYRHKLSEAQKRRFARDGAARSGAKDSPETRERKRQAHLGERSYWYGKHHSEETRAKLSAAVSRAWQGEAGKRWREYARSDQHRETMRQTRHREYEAGAGAFSPEAISRRVRSTCPEPNLFEAAVAELLDAVFPGRFEYVGNGGLVLGVKCPDFVDRESRRIVEAFGTHWHRGEDPAERIAYFRRFGYETLVIWERELSDPEALAIRVAEFGAPV